MPDIQLRFLRDMLVVSAPIDATLARQGVSVARDRQYLNLMEPDAVVDALRLEVMAGAHCVVTTTEDITQARLAHVRMDSDAKRLVRAALSIASEVKPQHILAEIGPCGLPLDASSKASLNENRGQYADAARAFEGGEFDAFFLNGFTSIADLKCALMGVAQVSEKPVFASVTVGRRGGSGQGSGSGQAGESPGAASASASAMAKSPSEARSGASSATGVSNVAVAPSASPSRASTPATAAPASAAAGSAAPATAAPASARTSARDASDELQLDGYEWVDVPAAPPAPNATRTALDPELWPEAVDAMVDLGASVVGFETADPIADALSFAAVASERTSLPLLAQLRVAEGAGRAAKAAARNLVPLADIDEYTPDTMATAAVKLYGAGVQFLRATGAATPAYTGALAATVTGLDVRSR